MKRWKQINWIVIFALLPTLGQSPTPDWQTAAGGTKTFDVASVHKDASGVFRPPSFPLDAGDSYANTGGRFFARFPLQIYITFAYKLMPTAEQTTAMLANLPKWVSSDVFEIEARAPISNPTKNQMRLMMQSLLADRFKLAVHFETREAPVLALTLVKPGKTGPKLRPHEEGPSCDTSTPPEFFPGRCNIMGMLPRPNGARIGGARDVTMAYIANALPTLNNLGRPMIDKTALTGSFDFTIEWSPDTTATNAATQSDSPSFVEALREQLGLKLDSAKAPVQMLVIDHIELPSDN